MKTHPLDYSSLLYTSTDKYLNLDMDGATQLPEIRDGITDVWVRGLNGPLTGIPSSVKTLTVVECLGFLNLERLPEGLTTLRLIECPDYIDLGTVGKNVSSLMVFGCPDVDYRDIIDQLDHFSLEASGFASNVISDILGAGCREVDLYDPDNGVALELGAAVNIRALSVDCAIGTISLEIKSLPECLETLDISGPGSFSVSIPEMTSEPKVN